MKFTLLFVWVATRDFSSRQQLADNSEVSAEVWRWHMKRGVSPYLLHSHLWHFYQPLLYLFLLNVLSVWFDKEWYSCVNLVRAHRKWPVTLIFDRLPPCQCKRYLISVAKSLQKANVLPFTCFRQLSYFYFFIVIQFSWPVCDENLNWWTKIIHRINFLYIKLNSLSQTMMDKGLTVMFWLTSRLNQSLSFILYSDYQHPIPLD